MESQWRLLAVAAATLLALAGCATVTPDGSLSIDARPNQTYVVVLQGTTTVHAGYGDVTLSGLTAGDYTVLAARGERSNTTSVHVAPGRSTSADAHVSESDDSDQPEWAGRDGDREKTPGSGMQGSDTEKGDLFGDLYILVRDDNGVPITIDIAGEYYVQPAAFEEGADGLPARPVYQDLAGDPTFDASTGMYYPLAIDSEGSLTIGQTLNVDGQGSVAVIPKEVDLGRLNEARAPSNVLERAYDEAIANLSSSVKPITQDPMGRLEYWTDDQTRTAIDSPLENLALYQKLMTDGSLTIEDAAGVTIFDSGKRPPDPYYQGTSDPPGNPDNPTHVMLDYAAAMLSAAADKTGDIDVDVVITMNNFLGINGDTAPEYFQFGDYVHERLNHFGNQQAEILVQDQTDPNTYHVSVVDVFDPILKGVSRHAEHAKGFAAAADDDLTVLEYVHNYAPPEPLD